MASIKVLAQQLNGLSHHAYCIVGGDYARSELVSILEDAYKIKTHGNPDFFDARYETFTIDDARQIKVLAGTMPMAEGGKKLFILQVSGITVEAQNALLKLLEEPGESVHIFLIIPSAHLLLPTVKSRMAIIRIEDGKSKEISNRKEQIANMGEKHKDASIKRNTQGSSMDASAFIKLSVPKRLDAVKSLMDDITKEKRAKQDAIDFLDAIEEAVHAGGVKNNVKALEAIETARTYMNDRSPSLKMLLEYVALNI